MVKIVAAMVKTKKLCTYDDYAALPDDRRYELIWGEIMMSPSPNIGHQAISRTLVKLILTRVERTRAGFVYDAPCDVVLDAHTTVQPDVIFVSNERKRIITDENIQGAPDLLVEIISPGTEDRDRLVKTRLYRESGVREFWLVDREARRITMFTPNGAWVYDEGDVLESRVLPGLKSRLRPLFKIRR
jgi:Uma2 family endonuclease